MRAPLSWLQSLTPLEVAPTDGPAVADLAAELDALGLVVESVERVGEGLGDVVLARVLEIGPIAGADRIRRVVVDNGSPEPVEVVCGAWNFQIGDIVPLAPVGAVLPGGFRIDRRKMKGVVSNGMICSARELTLGDDHEGILVLASAAADGSAPRGVELGRSLADHLGISADVVFDLAVEPNRPDCLCMLGVARDLAARFRLPLHTPEPVISESDPDAGELASVAVQAPELCFRFTGRVLTRLAPMPAPTLVQRRLALAGMRPINAVVDASNYVMLELGQPTHPYDLDRLGGRGLLARAARRGETVVTLDGETRTLGTRPPRPGDPLAALDCLICNADDEPVGIGGVMGGRSSEVDDATSAVLLEAALFRPVAVGRTARSVGLRTEASVRFERGVDPEGVERASARVCELVVQAAESAGMRPPVISRRLLDDYPAPFSPVHVAARPARVNALLGTQLTADDMVGLLAPIGYSLGGDGAAGPAGGERTGGEPAGGAGAVLDFVAPSFRPDVHHEVDVAEDVARTFGYRNIARTDRRSPYVGRLDAVQQLRRQIRRILCGLGAHEAWTSSIVDPAQHARAGFRDGVVALTNPMVAEESVLRPGLLASLLTAVRYNTGHRHAFIRLFEIGNVFSASEVEGELPLERERVALILAREGDGAASAVEAWRTIEDALRLEGVDLDQQAVDTQPGRELAGLHQARAGVLALRGEGVVLGSVGEVDPGVTAAFGLPHDRIGWLELDLVTLAAAPRRSDQALPVSRYPSSDVDLAFVAGDSVPAARLLEVLRGAGTDLCESVELFDVYRGRGLEEGKRSLTFRLRFCAQDHTLTDAEVAELRQRCIEAVQSVLPATLRS
ncbi:MAG TPA: phenylalanine--tRNA ligase subunit beta [Acidimicrobiales bacterium]|nr:phenylalanine--tRNA ligase subunit beta [Acidimicrobiales bacterium]